MACCLRRIGQPDHFSAERRRRGLHECRRGIVGDLTFTFCSFSGNVGALCQLATRREYHMFQMISKKLLQSGFIVVGLFLSSATTALADHNPYYFLDSGSNKRSLYVNANCGHGMDCVRFGTACETVFYSSPTTKDAGLNALNRGEKLYIRENSSPYDVVCTVLP